MPFLHFADISLHYEMRGDGPPLLVITGTNGDLRRKPSVLDSPLVQHFSVLAYDQRGLGQSSKPDRPYSMADYGNDAAAVMDAIGWRSAPVLAFSFGGMVAQEFALRHPGKVKRLALACTSPGGRGGASYPLHEIATLSPAERARHLLPLQDARCDAAWIAANPERAEALMDAIIARARPVDPSHPDVAMGARRQLEARARHDAFDRLPRLAMPVAIFAGRYDRVAAPAAQEAMQRQIRGARLRFFEGGHLFYMQDPPAYPAMIEFLAG